MKHSEAMRYVVQWWQIVRTQRDRITGSARRPVQMEGTASGDCYLFVLAVHNFRTAVQLVKEYVPHEVAGEIRRHLREFDKGNKDLITLRDVLMHLDEYARGTGNRQKKAVPQLRINYSDGPEEFTLAIHLAAGVPPLLMNVNATTEAVDELFRCTGRSVDHLA